MRLLLVGPAVTELAKVRNFSGVWSYYLGCEFRKRGIELEYIPRSDLSVKTKLDGISHILALGTRAFEKIPSGIGTALMGRMEKRGGLVTQIHDGPTANSPCHVTFHLKPFRVGFRSKNENCWVGWAADRDLFFPEQPRDILQILIDHPQLKDGEPEDYSHQVWHSVAALVRKGALGFRAVVVRRIRDGGIDIIQQLEQREWPRYERQTIPYETMAAAVRRSHLFMVTHPESVGMMIVEAAMAGCLPVIPLGCANLDLLKSVRCFSYSDLVIPWGDVLGMVNPEAVRKSALKNNWSDVTDRILAYLENRRS